METLSSIPFKLENTEPLEEETGSNRFREKEDFFQWNIVKAYKSSAESNPLYETVWHLFGPKQPVETYRNEVFDWTKLEKSGYARILSAEHTELDRIKEDYLERDNFYKFALWCEQDVAYKLFLQLAATWKHETKLASSLTDIVLNDNYLQIIGMGSSVIPFILKSLKEEPYHWFHALRSISREDPILPEHRGNIRAMVGAWISWGKNKGIV